MTYRSDADAAQARIQSLEAELAVEQAQIARLRADHTRIAADLHRLRPIHASLTGPDVARWVHQTYLARMGMVTVAVVNAVLLMILANA
jgi:multidrug resistance efflux pump